MKYPQINVPFGAVKYYPRCNVFIDGENKRMDNGMQPMTGAIIRFNDRKDFINETFELEFIFARPKSALSRDDAIKLLAALEHNPFVSAELNELKQYGWSKRNDDDNVWFISSGSNSIMEHDLEYETTLISYPEIPKQTVQATEILTDAAETIGSRASERDVDSERSMKTAVAAFNAMYGTELTETQGWMFMVFLKAARAKGGNFKLDDYIDGAAYFALAGECEATK